MHSGLSWTRIGKGLAVGVATGWLYGSVCMTSTATLLLGMREWKWYAPIMVGTYWTIVGGFIGTMIGWWGGRPEVIGTLVAAIFASASMAISRRPDGWLFLTMPLNTWLSALLGLAAVGAVRFIIFQIRRTRPPIA